MKILNASISSIWLRLCLWVSPSRHFVCGIRFCLTFTINGTAIRVTKESPCRSNRISHPISWRNRLVVIGSFALLPGGVLATFPCTVSGVCAHLCANQGDQRLASAKGKLQEIEEVPGTRATPALMSYIAYNKYRLNTPVYRNIRCLSD